MNYIKNWENFNPKKSREIETYLEINKRNLWHLWDWSVSDYENLENIKKYFLEFPEETKSNIRFNKIKVANSKFSNPLLLSAPILQNIGGVYTD